MALEFKNIFNNLYSAENFTNVFTNYKTNNLTYLYDPHNEDKIKTVFVDKSTIKIYLHQ